MKRIVGFSCRISFHGDVWNRNSANTSVFRKRLSPDAINQVNQWIVEADAGNKAVGTAMSQGRTSLLQLAHIVMKVWQNEINFGGLTGPQSSWQSLFEIFNYLQQFRQFLFIILIAFPYHFARWFFMNSISYQNMKVCYEYVPSPEPTAGNLVLLHSLGLSMEEFDPILPFFHPAFNVLRFDLLGHGKSELPSASITIDLLVNLVAFMTGQFFKGNFYMVACPGSGYVASRFCRVHKPSISGLVMISPQPDFLSLEEKQQIVQQMETMRSNGFQSFKQFLLSHFTIHQDSSHVARLAKLLDQVSETVHHRLIHSWLNEDYFSDFRYIHTPILVLAGMQDTLFPSSTYGITASVMKAEFTMIPAAAHLVTFDNPQASVDAILDFFVSIESGKPAKQGFTLRREEIAKALYGGFEQKDEESKPVLFVHLLYTFRVQSGHVELIKGWNLRKVKSLFLYLLFNGTVTREEIIEVFWPDLPMQRARNQLRMNLHYLRSLLSQGDFEFLFADREHIFLQNHIQCDATDYVHRLKGVYTQMLCGVLDIQDAIGILEVSPRKLLTHVYDEWYLQFRDEIEMQFIALCQWTSNQLVTVQRSDEASKYQRWITKLRD